MKTVSEIINFLKKQEAIARCEKHRDTVEHCTCLSYCLYEILQGTKHKFLDVCPQCKKKLPVREFTMI